MHTLLQSLIFSSMKHFSYAGARARPPPYIIIY
nr:MAG TPA: hypothetical protein [Caudoviricetes sp.]